MEIKKTYGLDKGSMSEQNIFIPICLGNKFFFRDGFLTENFEEYVKWGLRNSAGNILIIIADKIQDTNYFVRSNRSEEASLRAVLKEGEEVLLEVTRLIKDLDDLDKKRVKVIRWNDYFEGDDLSNKITEIIYSEFNKDSEFKKEVVAAVKGSIEDRVFTDEEYLILSKYVLDEFCIVYSGLKYLDNEYLLYIYPFVDTVLDLIEDIKRGEKFKSLKDKLPGRRTGVVILR